MKNWTNDQFSLIVNQWDDAMGKYYPQYLESWKNSDLHFNHINEVWNYFEASKIVDWDSIFLNENSRVLDLGAGTGWLSAYLSKHKNVDKIYSIDSSKYFLSSMLPEIVDKMGGVKEKIEPIEGLFSPIILGDETIDVIVASSSLHHADNLEDVLSDINRVLKKGGTLVILNETPASYLYFLYFSCRFSVSIFRDLIFKKYSSTSKFISSSCVLYDPYLGDKAYPLWYWEKALEKAKFINVNIIPTNLRSYKTLDKGPYLKHFIARKAK
jgi:SAM-dependent methyltransferase